MIKSVNKVKTNILNPGEENYVYIRTSLEVRGGEYIAESRHFIIDENNNYEKTIFMAVDRYGNDQINAMYSALKTQLENLPFTDQIQTGVEMVLLDWFNNNERYGVPVNSGGWELV